MKSTFFGGSDNPGDMNPNNKHTVGFIKKDKALLAELKANFNAIIKSFQNESANIIAASQKKSATKAENIQANEKLARWNESPLQLLIATKAYDIPNESTVEFSRSGEFLRLKKMFLDVDLDFSNETTETQAAIHQFVTTFKEFERWLQERENLMQVGSMDSLLADAPGEAVAIDQYDSRVEKFKHNCNRSAEILQDTIKTLFIVIGSRTNSVDETALKLQTAKAELRKDDITQEQHSEQLKIIATLQAEQAKAQDAKLGSQFYPLYCDYKDASFSLDPAELVKSDLYERMRLLVLGNEKAGVTNFSNEKPEVQKLVVALRNHLNTFENMCNDGLFLAAYPELRKHAYQSPKHL